jgi:hypothetical protein
MKTMEHTVREMALLAAFVGLLAVGAVTLKADLPVEWFRTKCERCERTDPPPPVRVMLSKPKEPMDSPSKDRDEATHPVELVEAIRSDANEEFPVRDEFPAWITTPVARVALTR